VSLSLKFWAKNNIKSIMEFDRGEEASEIEDRIIIENGVGHSAQG
jgi:hypothetical protein